MHKIIQSRLSVYVDDVYGMKIAFATGFSGPIRSKKWKDGYDHRSWSSINQMYYTSYMTVKSIPINRKNGVGRMKICHHRSN